MALNKCPECDHEVSSKAEACQNCGHPFKKASSIGSGFATGFLALVIAFLTIFTFVNLFDNGSSVNNRSNSPSPRAVVENSVWDASVSQVKTWLKTNLKDPNSLEYIEWSPVSNTNDGGFTVRVKYRAKNSLGGYVVDNKLFYLNSAGVVIRSRDF